MPELVRRLARVLKIGAVVGVAVGVVRTVRGSTAPPVTGQASWPPLVEPSPTAPRTAPVQFVAPARADQRWVEPVDGECPSTHPIKGNADSGIYHVPGGLSYDRTVPERCYATEADAEADGFRRAKR